MRSAAISHLTLGLLALGVANVVAQAPESSNTDTRDDSESGAVLGVRPAAALVAAVIAALVAGRGKDESSDSSDSEAPATKPEATKAKKSKPKDPLGGLDAISRAEAELLDEDGGSRGGFNVKNIHIRVQQRNARKSITSLQGLPDEFDLKRMLKHFKKTFGCLGAVVNDKEMGKVIQLAGDQRIKLREFLTSEGIAEKKNIYIHGS
ncbi:Eukaryotic translation initiation factor eIF-1 [Coemansia javaensis]|uniref:Eukaryotic translation initiation factor eIF-1 n=1 Tax=Coemansia javaensis TaxID=2761396 RepID=A0A9W8LNB4_9FUNG|nr:Eukaryotic translation initiation factor eIF-1 [Coemansia javaensis]